MLWKRKPRLHFVRCGSILVQRGMGSPVPAALLGRFLPRLGPSVFRRPFFLPGPMGQEDVRLYSAAARYGVALEMNCQEDRLDLNDVHARLARDRGVRVVISTDAHSVAALGNLRWGVHMARRAWLGPDDVLNTRDVDALRPLLRRHRRA